MNWLTSVFRKKKVSVLFVPVFADCAVDQVFKFIGTKAKGFDLHYLPVKHQALTSALKHRRVLIFAHPERSGHGLANSVNSAPLLPGNFRFLQSKLEIFGNICRGTLIMRNTHWQQVAEKWISFSTDISLCSGTIAVDKFWTDYYLEILRDLDRSEDLSLFHNNLRKFIHSKCHETFRASYIGHTVVFTCLGGYARALSKHP